jgi:tetratricopeptide (TPR) repeat protein
LGTTRPGAGAALLASLGLVVLTLLTFAPVLGHSFVDYDDPDYVTNNPQVKAGLTRAGAAWAFTTTHAANWHPLTWLSLQLDATVYGPGSAWGFHLTNLLLHTAAVVLLFLALRRMTGTFWRSLLVAALFAVHPLHVESVAWVAERKDVLSGFFWMLTLLAYAWYVERPGWRRYLPMLAAFALGLMAKPMVVTLPCVLLLLDYWPLNRLKSEIPNTKSETNPKAQIPRTKTLIAAVWSFAFWVWGLFRISCFGFRILEKVPLFALTIASCAITVVAQRSAGAVWFLGSMSLGTRLGNAVVAYVGYLRKAVVPTDLCVFYPHPRDTLSMTAVAGSALLLAALTAACLAAGRRRPAVAVGWLWFLGTLVPVIGLVQVGEQALADRYTYIPLVGVFIAIVWGPLDWLAGKRALRGIVSLGAAAAVFACAVAARGQLRFWEDSTALWERCLALDPKNYLAEFGLGNVAMSHGQSAEAEAHYTAALAVNPNLWLAHHNLGLLLRAQGKLDGAIDHLRAAAHVNPRFAETQNQLGLALAARDGAKSAVEPFRRAVAAAPAVTRYRYNLAWALSDAGEAGESQQEYRSAREGDPGWPGRAADSAWRLATDPNPHRRNAKEAMRLAEQAAQATEFREARFVDVLAAAYAEAGRFDDAVGRAQLALELAHDDSDLTTAIAKRVAGYREHRPFRQGN